MTTFIKISLIELLENPKRFLGTPVEVEGKLTYIGKSPRPSIYSINLPDEKYCIGLLKKGDKQLLCFGLENICLDKYHEANVIIKGFFIRLHDSYAIKVVSVQPSSSGNHHGK